MNMNYYEFIVHIIGILSHSLMAGFRMDEQLNAHHLSLPPPSPLPFHCTQEGLLSSLALVGSKQCRRQLGLVLLSHNQGSNLVLCRGSELLPPPQPLQRLLVEVIA